MPGRKSARPPSPHARSQSRSPGCRRGPSETTSSARCRRYGKSSLVWRATQQLAANRVLVAQIDLMTASTKEQLAAKIAQAIYEEIATPLYRARDRASQVFRGLRIAPMMTVDPNDGSLGFSFRA